MARPVFNPIIKKVRPKAVGYSPYAMLQIGEAARQSIFQRLDRAQDQFDQPAPPLSAKYAGWKGRKYGSSVRDLRATGRTRRGIRVKEAGLNYVKIGPIDPVAEDRLRMNNRRSRQWALSPNDYRAIHQKVHDLQERIVVVERIA